MISTKIPLGLYIHFPWCVSKCPYCDFNSHALRRTLPDKAYVEALKQDFLGQVPSIGHRKIATIFMGGGTPSLFSASCIADILDFLKVEGVNNFSIKHHKKLEVEISIANTNKLSDIIDFSNFIDILDYVALKVKKRL